MSDAGLLLENSTAFKQYYQSLLISYTISMHGMTCDKSKWGADPEGRTSDDLPGIINLQEPESIQFREN